MRTFVCSLVLLFACSILRAEPPRDPEKLAAYFLERVSVLDFAELPDFTHPEDLAKYKALHVEAARLAEEIGALHYFELLSWAKSSKDIESMAPGDVYASFMNGMIEMLRERAPEQFEEMKKQMQGMKIDVIGHTMDGENVMLVNYRFTVSAGEHGASEVRIMPLRRNDSSWLLAIEEENFQRVQQTIEQFKKAKGGEPGATDNPGGAQ